MIIFRKVAHNRQFLCGQVVLVGKEDKGHYQSNNHSKRSCDSILYEIKVLKDGSPWCFDCISERCVGPMGGRSLTVFCYNDLFPKCIFFMVVSPNPFCKERLVFVSNALYSHPLGIRFDNLIPFNVLSATFPQK